METTLVIRYLLEESADPENPPPERLVQLLEEVQRIAVVGLSRDPAKAARRVPSYLAAKGYEVVPVNPHADRLLGRPAAGSLDEVVEPVDMVLIFRPSSEAASHLRDAAARPERPIIWLQEGILAPTEAAEARAQGLTVIQDMCAYKVHRVLPT